MEYHWNFANRKRNFFFIFIFIIFCTVLVTSLGEIQWENPLNSIESRHISSVRRFFVKFLLSIMICLVFLICIFPFGVVPDEDVKYHGSQNKPIQRVSMFLIWIYTFGFAMGTYWKWPREYRKFWSVIGSFPENFLLFWIISVRDMSLAHPIRISARECECHCELERWKTKQTKKRFDPKKNLNVTSYLD